MIVEDVRGLVNNLTIYNYPTVPDSSTQYVGALFPPGTVLAIREPTFKMPTQGNTPIVRVDSPSDVIFLSPDSPFLRGVSWKSGQVPGTLVTPTTASSWKDLGNRHFKNSWWLPAAYAYSRGLELDPTSWASQSNRAEAYLRLKFYHSAAADAESVLSMGEVPELSRGKALFRLAKAKYGQCDYNVAKVLFEEWNRSNPEHSEGNAWLQRCQLRLSEVEDASYDWLNVLKNSSKELHVDISDFKGPVEVKSRREVGGGRGIFATRDIKCGELLVSVFLSIVDCSETLVPKVVSKPFVSVFAQDLPNNLSISLNVLTDTVYSASQSALLSRLAEKMYGNPELHSTVFALHAGPGTTPLTSFDYDPSQRQPLSNPMIPVIDIDIERLERISAFNTFEPNPLTVYGSPKPESKSTKSSAFYIFPSLFNHACLAKASWVCFGDVMVIRACEDATAGSEITLPYVGDPKYSERCRLLKKHFDECDCTLCTEDRTDGDAAIKRRDDIESALLGQVDRYSLDKVRDLSSQVASTYSKSRGPIRPLLAHLHYMTADKLRSLPNKTVANFKEACKEDYKALEASGIKVIDKGTEGPVDASHLPIATNFLPTSSYLPQLVISAMNVSQFFQQVKENNSRATCWLRAALWSEFFLS